ncbi:MAG: hypothetical protein RL701_100 [Pseudomonadota bacterium]
MILRSALCASVALFSGCSVDQFKNPQRKDKAECERLGGTPIGDKFCRFASAGRSGESGQGQAGAAGDDADAGPVQNLEPCGPNETLDGCYDGADEKTSLQMPCHMGTRVCRAGFWGRCENQRVPSPEVCNDADDDCDGVVDEFPMSSECSIDKLQGVCRSGATLCPGGAPMCAQTRFPDPETCDGLDNDCDGEVDEHTDKPCYDADRGCVLNDDGAYKCSGICLSGVKKCVEGKLADDCSERVRPELQEHCTEAKGVALDEDCDGKIDESCSCTAGASCYTGPANTRNKSPCKDGKQTCPDPMQAGVCKDEVLPKAEDCANDNGTDDDCNGVVDDLPLRDTSCSDVSKAQGACKDLALWQCADKKQVCVDAAISPEVCDGRKVDEDCDGKTDEGFTLATDRNNCGACGVKCGTDSECCAGQCVNTKASNANCGSCGSVCASTNTCCNGACTNTKTDGKNCGSCGKTCGLLGCGSGTCGLL